MKKKAVLFDLDGTLLDTVYGIAKAANGALANMGFPEHPVEEYNYFVGDGLQVLIERIVPQGTSRSEITGCVDAFERQYIHCCGDKTAPYPHILEMLYNLADKNIALGVLSNKPHDFTSKMVEQYFTDVPFQYIAGQQQGIAKKPDPAGVWLALDNMKVYSGDTLFVGDTSVDMQTATNSGMVAAGVSWGFRPVEELLQHGAEIIIDHPQEIVDYVTT